MPQPPIPEFWRERVKSHLAQIEQREKKPSDKWIRDVLEKEAEALREGGNAEERALADWIPSERTISRIRKEEWPRVEEEDRAQYRRFCWPESMERGDLPWEASAAALELLFTLEGEGLWGRPSIRQTKRFWQVTLAAPDASVHDRLRAGRDRRQVRHP